MTDAPTDEPINLLRCDLLRLKPARAIASLPPMQVQERQQYAFDNMFVIERCLRRHPVDIHGNQAADICVLQRLETGIDLDLAAHNGTLPRQTRSLPGRIRRSSGRLPSSAHPSQYPLGRLHFDTGTRLYVHPATSTNR